MIKKGLIIFFVIVSGLLATGQDNIKSEMDIHSLDVNTFTKSDSDDGRLKLQIPIYTLKVDEVEIPIKLIYDGSGVKVTDKSEAVGSNWKLFIGGEINCNIRGIKDKNNYFRDSVNQHYSFQREDTLNNFSYIKSENPKDLINGVIEDDFARDDYRYILPNRTGVFLLNDDDYSKVIPCEKSIKIESNLDKELTRDIYKYTLIKDKTTGEYISKETYDKTVNLLNYAVKLTNAKGTQFQFQPAKKVLLAGEKKIEDKSYYYDKYLLDSIKTTKGNYIKYNYDSYQRFKVDYSQMLIQSSEEFIRDYIVDEIHNNHYYSKSDCKSIVSGNYSISFKYITKDQFDHYGSLKKDKSQYLSKIVVSSGVGLIIKEVDLEYEVKGPEKVFLKSISIGNNDSKPLKYSFKYDNQDLLKIYNGIEPSYNEWWKGFNNYVIKKNIYKQDFYGYQNSNEHNHMVPFSTRNIHYPSTYDWEAASRFHDSLSMQAGVLKQVILPYGGKINYTYKPRCDDKYYGGGLVLRSIEHELSGNIINKYEFEYGNLMGHVMPKTKNELYKVNNRFIFGDKTKSGSYSNKISEIYFSTPQYSIKADRSNFDIIEDGTTSGNFYRHIIKKIYENGNYNGKIITYKKYKSQLYTVHGLIEKKEYYNSDDQIVKEESYDYVNTNTRNDLTMLSKVPLHNLTPILIENYHDKYTPLSSYFKAFGTDVIHQSGISFNVYLYNLQQSRISIGKQLLNKVVTIDYLNNDTRFSSESTMSYNEYDQLITKSLDVKGNTYMTVYRYTYDFLDQEIYKKMVNRNMLIRIEEFKIKGASKVFGKRVHFSSYNKFILPSKKDIYNLNGEYTTDIYYNKYDEFGNLTQFTAKNQPPTSLVISPDGLILAKFEGIKYEQIPDFVIEALNALNDDISDDEIYWINKHIRSMIPNAMITIYSYLPGVGVSSITNSDGITQFYKYDELGRVRTILDNEGNIIKESSCKMYNLRK